jgi:RNA polymerase sigma factor (sigma-70 family)
MKNIFYECTKCFRPNSKDCRTADEIYSRYKDKIYFIVKKVFRERNIPLSEDETKDWQQHIFEKLFDINKDGISCWRLRQYNKKRGASPNGWIAVIATRLAIQVIRDHYPDDRFYHTLSYDQLSEFIGSHHTVEQMEINEKNRLVEDAIKQLKPKKQLFCRYHFYDGLSMNETCDIMNMKREAGDTAKHRIIQEIKKHLFCRYHLYDGLSMDETCDILNLSRKVGESMKRMIIRENRKNVKKEKTPGGIQ